MRIGNQEPTFKHVGRYAYTRGDDVIEMFAEEGGATFYPCQEEELRLMLARNDDGSPAGMTIGISKPRQNGKSYAARFYAAYMADFEHRNVLYSAHHSSTTKKMFMALCDLFENPERFPEFAADVKYISHARGYEGIYFKNWTDSDGAVKPGGCIEFSTRTNSGSRGGTYSVIVIDEAQELTAEQQEAILPTMSAASDIDDPSMMPQQIHIGTPPGPACNGTVFSGMHEKVHAEESNIWWLEWSLTTKKNESIETVVHTKEKAIELAYMTNPAMGYRIAEETVANEFDNMSPAGFARERLGWWTPKVERVEEYAIPVDVWDACKSSAPKPDGKIAYGIKFTADSSEVVLCGASVPEYGPARISLIERRPTGYGTQWLADWLNQRFNTASCVVIDGRNGVDVLIDKISSTWRAKGSVIRASSRDVVAAVSTLTDALADQSVSWFDRQEDLRDSAVTSTRRSIGAGWGFGGENPAPIEAASLALWGAKTSKRNPTRRMRIG